MSTVLTSPGYHTELIDGQEIEKPLPKKLHARVQSYLIRVLAVLLSREMEVLPELNVLCGKDHQDRIVPDVTIVARSAQYRDGDLFDPAIVCVEILSPGQTLSNLFDKAERLLRGGTPVCWVIWPERRQAWMYRSEELHEATETLSAAVPDGSVLEIRLPEMWAELD
jgi:Uma2 family endonuclease